MEEFKEFRSSRSEVGPTVYRFSTFHLLLFTFHLSRSDHSLAFAISQPPMVKQILLGVPGVRTKVLSAEFGELRGCNLLGFREVFLSQHPRNPNINGHHFQSAESKQQNTIRDLITNTGETAERGADFIGRQLGKSRQGDFAGSHHTSG